MSGMNDWTTERLTIRPWRPDEADALLKIRGNPEVAQWLGSPEPWTSIAQAEDEIAAWERLVSAAGPEGKWAIVPNGYAKPVGTVSLGTIPASIDLPGSPETEIGWYLDPEANGNGWAIEAARSLLTRSLDSGVRRIWALMWKQNESSAKVARALGMRELGVIVDPWYGTEEDRYSRMFLARPT